MASQRGREPADRRERNSVISLVQVGLSILDQILSLGFDKARLEIKDVVLVHIRWTRRNLNPWIG